ERFDALPVDGHGQAVAGRAFAGVLFAPFSATVSDAESAALAAISSGTAAGRWGIRIGGRLDTGRVWLESHCSRSGSFFTSAKISATWLWSRVSSSSR